jgi:hypothetical protein
MCTELGGQRCTAQGSEGDGRETARCFSLYNTEYPPPHLALRGPPPHLAPGGSEGRGRETNADPATAYPATVPPYFERYRLILSDCTYMA